MKGRTMTVIRSLILILCVGLLCGTTLAAVGSLRVTVLSEDTPVAEIAVELCRVAELENDTFSLAEAFADLHFSPEDMAKEQTPEQAEQVFQYVMQQELEGTVVLTDREGCADFLTIPDGLYLVFERGDQAVAFRPYLLTIPTDGRYSVYSVPKTVSGNVKNISVFKEWHDEDNAAGKRPESLQITLYHDEAPVRSVTINEECGWEHTFIMLPAAGAYAVEESDVPGYTGTCEEVFEGFVLTNTYTHTPGPDIPPEPDDPDDPDPPRPPKPPQPSYDPPVPPEAESALPQTGFRMWPVYLILAFGVGLTVLGLVDVCLAKEVLWEEEQEES